MKVTLFFLLITIAFVFGQIERFTIDDFNVGANTHKVEITLNSDLAATDAPIVKTSFFGGSCTGLLGCGRNMKLSVSVGSAGRTCTSDIFTTSNLGFTAEWAISNPKNFKSVATLTYDGAVDTGTNINFSGLGGVDFTDGGLATGLRFFIISDLNATYTIDLYSSSGAVCTGQLTFIGLPGTYTLADTQEDLPYTSFTTGCNKASIGAVVVSVPSTDAVDALIRKVSVFGAANSPSASPTPSVTPTPSISPSNSPSNTPSPSISVTPTPTRSVTPTPSETPSVTPTPTPTPSSTPTPTRTPTSSPSESGPCVQHCVCPSFTCAIAYDRDDDVNDVLLNPSATIFIDDDDSTLEIIREIPGPIRYIYIYVEDSSDDVNVPTFTVPTFTVPTFTIPTFTIPEASPSPSPNPIDNGGNGSSSSDASSLVLSSVAVLLAALLI